MIAAAVDIGTNSVRLLVRDSDAGTDLERRAVITRLGEGTGASGRLRPEAIERTLAVLAEFRAVIDERGARSGASSPRRRRATPPTATSSSPPSSPCWASGPSC